MLSKPKRKSRIWLFFAVMFFSVVYFLHLYGVVDVFGWKEVKPVSSDKPKIITADDIFESLKFNDKKSLKGWKNKVFKGRTKYVIEEGRGDTYLLGESKSTASALYKRITYDIKKYPVLVWEWLPKKFPNKDGITNSKDKDDYALRVFVIFASGFFTNYRCVEYVWDKSLPEGTQLDSPYSEKIKQLVIRSGIGDGNWKHEERNVLNDYKLLFGEDPKLKVRAIAIMTDSEGSKDSSAAQFKEIKIVKQI